MLDGKVAVVTGGAQGIGRAICEKLASQGAKVVYLDRRVPEGDAFPGYACDVSDYDAVAATFKQIVADCGTVDILVNNAGITCDKLLLAMKPEEFDRVVKINLYGVFNTIKQVYPIFTRKRSGRIINISSVSGLMGNPGQANYAASKAGVVGLTKTVAKELGSRGVTCNAVAPGFVDTSMTTAFADSEKVLETIPLKRFATAQEVAGLVAYLASEEAAYITGAVFTVDGGMSCR